MTLKLAMYKGPPSGAWHQIGHTATRVWTRSRYSHCELVFDGPASDGKSLCASASSRDGGVRHKRINLASGRWDVYELPGFNASDKVLARQWFDDHAGAPYDHLALVWFVLPINAFDRSKRWFCSESVAAALRMRKPHKYHPQRLLNAATRA